MEGIFEISGFRKQTQKEFRIWTLFLVFASLILLALKRGEKSCLFHFSLPLQILN